MEKTGQMTTIIHKIVEANSPEIVQYGKVLSFKFYDFSDV